MISYLSHEVAKFYGAKSGETVRGNIRSSVSLKMKSQIFDVAPMYKDDDDNSDYGGEPVSDNISETLTEPGAFKAVINDGFKNEGTLATGWRIEMVTKREANMRAGTFVNVKYEDVLYDSVIWQAGEENVNVIILDSPAAEKSGLEGKQITTTRSNIFSKNEQVKRTPY